MHHYETGEAREAVIDAYQTLEDVDDILDHGGDEELRRLLEKEDREKRKVGISCVGFYLGEVFEDLRVKEYQTLEEDVDDVLGYGGDEELR